MLILGLETARVPLYAPCRRAGIGGRVTIPPGGGARRDALGNTVHLVLVGSTRWSLTPTATLYELEFDVGDFLLPPGTLYLTGGNRDTTYDVDVWLLPLDCQDWACGDWEFQRPGPLSVVATGAPYVAPESHNSLKAGTPTAFTVDGMPVALIGGQKFPIPAGATITAPPGASFSTFPDNFP